MAGGITDVLVSLAQQLCQHVLDPLLKLHPGRVSLETHTHQDGQGDAALDISFSAANARQQQHSYSVEGAALKLLQIFAGQAVNNITSRDAAIYRVITCP